MTAGVTLPTASRPRVSIVIVSARNAERLVRCLAAVAREAPPHIPLETIVVLNAPDPGMQAALRRDVAGARIVHTDVPLGLAGGLNLGAEHTRGEFVHVLHDDTEVCAGWLDGLVAALESDHAAGAAGSLVLDPDGRVQGAGWVLWRDGTTATPWAGPPPEPDSFGEAPFPVDYVASASLLVRRDVWEATGGADEDFHPAYYVDVDLALAIRSQGRTVLCAPRSRVRHAKAGTGGTRLGAFASERNRTRFVAKWANELERQEAPPRDRTGIERAAAAARRRPAVARKAVRPATSAVGPAKDRRDQALLRDLRVKDEYISHLEAIADENAVAIEESRRERDRLAEALGLTAAERDRLSAALALVEATRWWRLRRRVLPAVLAVRRVEGVIRRATTSRTG